MKTIYNTYVEMESQEQCDRMKQLCIDNKLKIWDSYVGFELLESNKFFCIDEDGDFCVIIPTDKQHYEITEQEFIELLNNYNYEKRNYISIIYVNNILSCWIFYICFF